MRNGKREILIGAVGLVMGDVRNSGWAMVAICDELEPEFERTGFLDSAPFKLVHLILLFGTEWGEPELGRINKRNSELEARIEMPMAEIRRLGVEPLKHLVKKVTLQVLVAVAQKYKLDGTAWEQQLASLG